VSDESKLTIEKFKLNERLQGVETQVALLRQSIEDLKLTKNEVHEHILQELIETRKVLFGTDIKKGLIVDVDRLNEAEKNRNRHWMAIWVIISGIIINAIYRSITIGQEFQKIETSQGITNGGH